MIQLFTNLSRTMVAYRREQTAIRELSALDDRMLKDLGISRGQILSAATGSTSMRRVGD
jgi:uncharacterized protein YjiS (DUF1127 family)